MVNRRTFLLAGGLLGASAYVNYRGLRYPRLSFEPPYQTTEIKFTHATLKLSNLIHTPKADFSFATGFAAHTTANLKDPDAAINLNLRAISPEPSLDISICKNTPMELRIGNIAENAQLKISCAQSTGLKVHETVDGINRHIQINSFSSHSITLDWVLTQQNEALFAVIGDTGAGAELEWCMRRAKNLGAQFLLHLGDFNYVYGEYFKAIELFNNAPLPCYVTIGNHDFNDSGLVYSHFLNSIGPLNHTFTLAGTRFINLDTAADFFPAYAGQRGALLNRLLTADANKTQHDIVCFTHRNFLDPRPGRDHTIGRNAERRWLADSLNKIGVKNVLTGHVHRSAEMEYRGLRQFTVGEGLGFEDIVHQTPVAQLLLGRAKIGQPVSYSWYPMQMPWANHTSPKHQEKLLEEHSRKKLHWYQKMLVKQA